MHPIIYIMGVSGSGKTTIGELLSTQTGLPFFDADDFHTAANKEKMKAGHSLNDEDRKQWLENLNRLAIEQTALKGAIISCSALKEKYRIALTNGVAQPIWIFLQGSYDLIYKRIQKRTGHFMPAALLQSQFNSLEVPVNAFTVNIEKEPDEIVTQIGQYLKSRRAV